METGTIFLVAIVVILVAGVISSSIKHKKS